MEQEKKGSRLRKDHAMCFFLTALALGVRLYGIRYGLPLLLKADEPYIIDSAIGNFYSQDPIILGWPGSSLVLLLFVLYFPYYLYLKSSGVLSSVEDFIFMYWNDPSTLYLIGRVCVALAGALTVLVLYRACSKMYGKATAGLSSAFLAFSFMHVRHSHFALPDIPMTLLLVMLVYLSYRILEGTNIKTYVIAGALCGLCVSLKFNSAIIVMPIILAHLLRKSAPAKDDRWKITSLIACMITFFYIGCPYVLTDPKAMIESIRNVVIWQKEIGNIRAIPTGSALAYLFDTVLPISTGWPMIIFSIIGFVTFLLKPNKKDLIVIVYPVTYVLLLSTSKTLFMRYAIPLIPFMALLSALAITRLKEKIRYDLLSTVVPIILSLLVLLPQVWKSILFDHMLTHTDTRAVARKWIIEQLPAGSRIILDHLPFSVPFGFNEWVLNYEKRDDRWGDLKYRYLDANSGKKVNSFKLMYTTGEVSDGIWDFEPDYVIVSSYVKNIFSGRMGETLKEKKGMIFKRRRAFYERVEDEGKLLMTFSPSGTNEEEEDDIYGVAINPDPGPVIKIYRMGEFE